MVAEPKKHEARNKANVAIHSVFDWPPHKGFIQVYVAIIALLLCISFVFVMFDEGLSTNKEWEITLQVVLQFIFVGVLATAVGAYFRDIESSRAEALRKREERRVEALRDQDDARTRTDARVAALQKFRNELVETYHSIKKVRRTLRASSLPATDENNYCCERQVFERLMDQLEDIQLRTATLADEVEAHKDLFGIGPEKDDLYRLLRTAKDYLREVLRVYEDQYAERRTFKATDLIQLGPSLGAFVHRIGEDETAIEGLFNPILNARKSVVRLIERNIPAERTADGRNDNMH